MYSFVISRQKNGPEHAKKWEEDFWIRKENMDTATDNFIINLNHDSDEPSDESNYESDDHLSGIEEF